MNETLYKKSTWLAPSKPSLNTDKTVYIEFGNPVDSPPIKTLLYRYTTLVKCQTLML